MRKVVRATALVALLIGMLPAAGVIAVEPPGMEVSEAVRHDVSMPLSGAAPASPTAHQFTERPLRLTDAFSGKDLPDAAVQRTSSGPQVPTTPGLGFEGIGKGQYGYSVQYAPPDTVGAVGATQYVQWVNVDIAVFDKSTGAIVSGFPKPGNAVWAGFGGVCETSNDGDPIVQYDKAANRWILTQFAVSATPYTQCIAVSTTSDATGTYNRYAYSYGTGFNDYPKLSVWPDAYYITYNIFANASTYAGPKACALDRAAMLTGAAATQVCFQLANSVGPLLPSDLDGSNAPAAGSPNYLLTMGGSTSLNLYKFHVDFATPGNSTLSGPTAVAVPSYTRACNGGGACLTQPGTNQRLDSLADRLMYRLAFRHTADGVDHLLVNHSVKVSGNIRNQVVGVRWYELRSSNDGSSWANYQSGTYSPNTTSRWMGSIGMDKNGNVAVGYTASSGSVYPSVRYAARAVTDLLGTLSTEVTVKAGTGSQLANLSRWGDYSAMTIDPVDDCTFWYTSEYMKSNGTFNWNTWITSFKLNGCS